MPPPFYKLFTFLPLCLLSLSLIFAFYFATETPNCKCAVLTPELFWFVYWLVRKSLCEVNVCAFSLCALLKRVLYGWVENPNKININKLCMAYAKTKLGGEDTRWGRPKIGINFVTFFWLLRPNDDVLFYDLMWFDVMWMVNLLTITHRTMRECVCVCPHCRARTDKIDLYARLVQKQTIQWKQNNT